MTTLNHTKVQCHPNENVAAPEGGFGPSPPSKMGEHYGVGKLRPRARLGEEGSVARSRHSRRAESLVVALDPVSCLAMYCQDPRLDSRGGSHADG